MKKLVLVSVFLLPLFSQASSVGQMVKAQLWYEGLERQPQIEDFSKKVTKDRPTKTVSSLEFIEELSRPMHLVLKKHKIIIKQ